MLAATSVLQQQASDVRSTRVNWQSYVQSRMLSEEDYKVIVSLDNFKDKCERERYVQENGQEIIRTFYHLIASIAKEQTLQYVLIMIDDYIQEDPSRIELFHEFAQKSKESTWAPFLNLLNRGDGFINNMSSRIVAKMACWSKTPMERTDLHFYLTWLKDQLFVQVSI